RRVAAGRAERSGRGAHRQSGSPRQALILVLLIGASAAASDWVATQFTIDEYRRSGHLHIRLDLTALGLSLTGAAVLAVVAWWRHPPQHDR
ncbi:MAG: hypothetical protein JNL80_13255, partial [Phycisphaerae bacterium]|nr:hypothetical protein [Phycisphaerae bacterium]